MNIWALTLISVTIVSLISLIGVFTLLSKPGILQRTMFLLVSFAVGGLFGDAMIHLLPEAFTLTESKVLVSFYTMLGLMLFFALEKFLRWRHCHDYACESVEHVKPVVIMNLISDAAHNFIDGLVIGASYLVSLPIGIATTIAVVLHEIPQEIGDFAILVNGGMKPRKALFFNFICALTAFIGAVISLVFGTSVKGYSVALLPFTAGGFIYIAGSDLIPELHHQNKLSQAVVQLLFIVLGIGVMFSLLLVE